MITIQNRTRVELLIGLLIGLCLRRNHILNGLGLFFSNRRRGRHTWFIRSAGGGGDDDLVKNQLPLFENIRWGDLLLDPDPNNILAVGLTGLLTWASVQVLWHLLFIALAILVAAVKYSFIAAVLLVILITLL